MKDMYFSKSAAKTQNISLGEKYLGVLPDLESLWIGIGIKQISYSSLYHKMKIIQINIQIL